GEDDPWAREKDPAGGVNPSRWVCVRVRARAWAGRRAGGQARRLLGLWTNSCYKTLASRAQTGAATVCCFCPGDGPEAAWLASSWSWGVTETSTRRRKGNDVGRVARWGRRKRRRTWEGSPDVGARGLPQ